MIARFMMLRSFNQTFWATKTQRKNPYRRRERTCTKTKRKELL